MQLSGVDLAAVAVQYVCLLFSLCVHEAAHAFMANRCGDQSARLMGRMTLNPLAHIDPIGTVVMPLLMMVSRSGLLFGWAKPVPFNPRNLHNLRRDPALIGLAGPGSNLLLAVTCALVLRIIVMVLGAAPDVPALALAFVIVTYLIEINLVLALFNLIPVPPLDGSHLLHSILPPEGQRVIERIGPFGIIIAIFVASRFLSGPLHFLDQLVMSFVFWGQA